MTGSIKFKITDELLTACSDAVEIYFAAFAHPALIVRFSNDRQKSFLADGKYPDVRGDQAAEMIPIPRQLVRDSVGFLELSEVRLEVLKGVADVRAGRLSGVTVADIANRVRKEHKDDKSSC